MSIDDPIAALAIETMANHDFSLRTPKPQTFIFHRRNPQLDAALLTELSKNVVPTCLQVRETELFFCTSSERAAHVIDDLQTDPLPSGLVFTSFDGGGRDIVRSARGVTIGKSAAAGIAAFSRNAWVPTAGEYTVVWDVVVADATSQEGVVARLEVLVDDKVVATAPVWSRPSRQRLTVSFETLRERQAFSWRLWLEGEARLTIENAELRLDRRRDHQPF